MDAKIRPFFYSGKLKSKFRRSKSGQALLEYVALLGLGAAVCLGIVKTVNEAIGNGIIIFNAALEVDLRSGSFIEAPNRVYSN